MAKRKGDVMVEPLKQVADTAPAAAEAEMTRPMIDADMATLSESQQAGVRAGNIRASWDTVEVSDKASPTGKGAKRAYIRLEALNAQGLAQVFDGKINPATSKPATGDDTRTDDDKRNGACDYANYGLDLERRAYARAQLMNELEGPEKLVKKAVLAMLAIGLEPADVKASIIGSPKFKGVDGLGKLVDAAMRS